MPCLRIAYDGSHFFGSQRQPDLRTVENDILDVLIKTGYIKDTSELDVFRMASRTDKGVSARQNLLNIVCGKDSDLVANNRLDRMNDLLNDIWITGYSPQEFHGKVDKTYHYHLINDDFGKENITLLCKVFSGTHDFSAFSKINPAKEPVRVIDIDFLYGDDVITLQFKGRGFLWQMCRRIANAFIMNLNGELGMEDIISMLENRTSAKIKPASPLNLILYGMDSDLHLEEVKSGFESMYNHYEDKRSRAILEKRISSYMLPGL